MVGRISIFVMLAMPLFMTSCNKPPRPPDEVRIDYLNVLEMRRRAFHSAAYLLDLRVDDNGDKHSVTTEVYFSGDSIGIYGRGYLGKGAIKGQIIDDRITVYFSMENKYYTDIIVNEPIEIECASPGEALLYVISLIASRVSPDSIEHVALIGHDISFVDGRYNRTITLDRMGVPRQDELTDPVCGDSIVIRYMDFSREFPFYRVRDVFYYNSRNNFRATGYIREQKYNIGLDRRKFEVEIPPDAVRLNEI